MVMYTGAIGARRFLELLYTNMGMTYEAARKRAAEEVTEDGTYAIHPTGIEYKGLHNPDMEDGYHLTQRREEGETEFKFYVEQWYKGSRITNVEITEEAYNKMRRDNETGDT
jgi:hypothetical protein